MAMSTGTNYGNDISNTKGEKCKTARRGNRKTNHRKTKSALIALQSIVFK